MPVDQIRKGYVSTQLLNGVHVTYSYWVQKRDIMCDSTVEYSRGTIAVILTLASQCEVLSTCRYTVCSPVYLHMVPTS